MYHTNDQCLKTLLFRKWKYFCLYFFLCSKWKQMLLNEKRKFALTFKIETKLRDQGTSLLRKSFFWCLKSLMAWTACGILGILGGDYSRRRSPRPPTELANLSLENTENTCKRIVSAKRDLAYRDQVELVIQPRMDKLQQVYKIYQAQKRSEIAADLSSLDNSAFRQNEKQLRKQNENHMNIKRHKYTSYTKACTTREAGNPKDFYLLM